MHTCCTPLLYCTTAQCCRSEYPHFGDIRRSEWVVWAVLKGVIFCDFDGALFATRGLDWKSDRWITFNRHNVHAYNFWSPASKMESTKIVHDFTAKIASSTTHELGTATPYISRPKAYKLRTPFCQLRSSGSYQITPNLFFSDLRLRQLTRLGVRWSRGRRVTGGEVGKLFSTKLREMVSLVSQYAQKR